MKNDKTKIIKFEPKHKEILTNEEIIKMFSGLIRIIQKSADLNAEERTKQKVSNYERELSKKNKQLEALLKLNEELISKLSVKN